MPEQTYLDPGIGYGNRILLGDKVITIRGPLTMLAGWFHRRMTASCDRSLAYIGSNTRESLPARLLVWEFAFISWALLHNQVNSETEFVVCQDMLAQGLRLWYGGELTLLTPDVYGKAHSWPSNLRPPDTIRVWNPEAKEKLEKRFGDKTRIELEETKVIKRTKDQGSVTIPKILIKLSGSGADMRIVRLLEKRLEGQSIIKCRDLSCLPILAELKEGKDFRIVIFPSEMIMVLNELRDNGIRPGVLCFYPRGDHELDNLVYAIKEGLIRSICVPYRLQGRLKKLLEAKLEEDNRHFGIDYWFVAPEAVNPENFPF